MLGIALAYMLLTLFIVRISFAAAMAAGDAGLSCCSAGGCCACSGIPEPTRQIPGPAANRAVASFFIRFPSIAALRPFKTANSLRARQHHHVRQTDEQPVLDNARDQAQLAGQAGSIGYQAEMGIDNPVAAIGDESMAVGTIPDTDLPRYTTLPEHPSKRPPGRGQSERDDFDR